MSSANRSKSTLYYFFMFLFAILLQVFVLDHVQVNGMFTPTIYIVFVLILPIEISGAALLLLSFLLGLSIDVLSYTPGLHALATVVMAFARISLLPALSPKGEYESGNTLSSGNYGWGWYLKYSGLMVIIHHFVLYFAESFSFNHFTFTLLQMLSGVVATMLILVLTQVSKK